MDKPLLYPPAVAVVHPLPKTKKWTHEPYKCVNWSSSFCPYLTPYSDAVWFRGQKTWPR
jgi:hypothetical protein